MWPTVFLDTNVFKFSATALRRYVGRRQTTQWGPLKVDSVVYAEQLLNPNDKIQNPQLKAEADLLPAIAKLGLQRRAHFVISDEAKYEQWGLPGLDSVTGLFFGASVGMVDAPITYARVMGGLGIDGRLEQLRFLSEIPDKRFLALQKAAGAYQGKESRNRNQLLDAFHLWCAEHNRCEFFLTLDFKLKRVLTASRAQLHVQVVTPSEFLESIIFRSKDKRHRPSHN